MGDEAVFCSLLLPSTPLISTTTNGLGWRLCFVVGVCVGLLVGCGSFCKQFCLAAGGLGLATIFEAKMLV
jgi:hypothetical protein